VSWGGDRAGRGEQADAGAVARRGREALLRSVTLDLYTTDVEVYSRCKQGVVYNYQGQHCGRPHVAPHAQVTVADYRPAWWPVP
jgi:GAF domain-containing protein